MTAGPSRLMRSVPFRLGLAVAVALVAALLTVWSSSAPAPSPSLTTRLLDANAPGSGTYTYGAPTQQLTGSNVLRVAGGATVTITGLAAESCAAQGCGWTTPVAGAEIATVRGSLSAAVSSSFVMPYDLQQSLAQFSPPLNAWTTRMPAIGARTPCRPLLRPGDHLRPLRSGHRVLVITGTEGQLPGPGRPDAIGRPDQPADGGPEPAPTTRQRVIAQARPLGASSPGATRHGPTATRDRPV